MIAASLTLTDGAQIFSKTLAPGREAPSPSPSPRPSPWRHEPRMGFPSAIFARTLGAGRLDLAQRGHRVTAASLALTEGAEISSSTFGSGRGASSPSPSPRPSPWRDEPGWQLRQWHLRPGPREGGRRGDARSPLARSPSRRALGSPAQLRLWRGRYYHPRRHGHDCDAVRVSGMFATAEGRGTGGDIALRAPIVELHQATSSPQKARAGKCRQCYDHRQGLLPE